MEKEQIAEMLKEKILDVEISRKEKDQDKRIVTVHLSADVFLQMAHLFIGIHGK